MRFLIAFFIFFVFTSLAGNCLTDYTRRKIKEYTEMIKENPDDPAGYYLRASFLWPFEEKAVPDYRKALELYLKSKKSIQEVSREDFLKAMRATGKDRFISKGLYFKKADLDGDGIIEVLLTNLDGLHSTFNFIFYQGRNGKWYIKYFRNCGDYLEEIHLEDLNRNGRLDIVYENLNGATGIHQFYIYEYADGDVRILCESSINGGGGDVRFEDLDSDGLKEITYICSPEDESIFYEFGIGPHLEMREVYRWEGKGYVLWKREYTNNSFNLLHQFLSYLMGRDFRKAYELVDGKKFLGRAGLKDSFENFKAYIITNFSELLIPGKDLPFDGGKVHDLGYGSGREFKVYQKWENLKTYTGSLKFRKNGNPFRLILLWQNKKWSIIGIERYKLGKKLPADGDIYNREF